MSTNKDNEIILVSACLMGLATRYDGKSKLNASCINALNGRIWVPVCPEQLGGLPTPRIAASITYGTGRQVLAGESFVTTREGKDVTDNFIKGANMVAEIAASLKVCKVYLKAGSPSCGLSGKTGVTAALLERQGFLLKEF